MWESGKGTYEAHGYAKADFLDAPHVEVPGDDPGEGSEDKVHDDVVYYISNK